MRKYILDFLKRQEPIFIYYKKEKHGLFSYLLQIWCDSNGRICSIFVIYTPITIISHRQYPFKVKMIGSGGDSFYERLLRMIVYHKDFESAVSFLEPDLNLFTNNYLHTCNFFLEIVLSKKYSHNCEGCELLNFDCVNSQLGIFIILYSIDGIVDYATLILGRENYIHTKDKHHKLKKFLDVLLNNVFEIRVGE